MKDTKLKDQLSQSYERFFQSSSNENHKLDITYNQEEKCSDEAKSDHKKMKKVFNILRQVFLFFPATFFTFYVWMGMAIFGFPTVDKPLFVFIMMLFPVLMVLGLGNIRNLKHWLSPLSVIILGLLFGLIPNLLPLSRGLFLKFESVILLFPLALITAVLAKNFADSLGGKDFDG